MPQFALTAALCKFDLLPAGLVDDNQLDKGIAGAIAMLKSLPTVFEASIKPLQPLKESAVSSAGLKLVVMGYRHQATTRTQPVSERVECDERHRCERKGD